MLKMRLEFLESYEVLVAEDGQTGCEKAAAEKPDVILMDLDLPVVEARRLHVASKLIPGRATSRSSL